MSTLLLLGTTYGHVAQLMYGVATFVEPAALVIALVTVIGLALRIPKVLRHANQMALPKRMVWIQICGAAGLTTMTICIMAFLSFSLLGSAPPPGLMPYLLLALFVACPLYWFERLSDQPLDRPSPVVGDVLAVFSRIEWIKWLSVHAEGQPIGYSALHRIAREPR